MARSMHRQNDGSPQAQIYEVQFSHLVAAFKDDYKYYQLMQNDARQTNDLLIYFNASMQWIDLEYPILSAHPLQQLERQQQVYQTCSAIHQ